MDKMDEEKAAERLRQNPVSGRLKRVGLAHKICTARGSDNVSSNLTYLISSSSASLLLSFFTVFFLLGMSLINLLFSAFVCASLWQLASQNQAFSSTNSRLCPSYSIIFIPVSRVLV